MLFRSGHISRECPDKPKTPKLKNMKREEARSQRGKQRFKSQSRSRGRNRSRSRSNSRRNNNYWNNNNNYPPNQTPRYSNTHTYYNDDRRYNNNVTFQPQRYNDDVYDDIDEITNQITNINLKNQNNDNYYKDYDLISFD